MISIAIIRSQKRRASLQLRAVDNTSLELRVPAFTTNDFTIDTIIKHTRFIERALAKSHPSVPGVIKQSDEIFINGEVYHVNYSKVATNILTANFPGSKEIIIPNKNDSLARIAFYKKIKPFVLEQLFESTKEWAKKMGNLPFKKVRIKIVRSLWGSCSSKGNISYNIKLVHYPKEIADYVVIHELAHLVRRDHSKYFWKIVAKYDRDYKKHRKILKSHQFG